MDKLTTYLQTTIPDYPEWQEMETYAKENRVPIMEPVSMHFMLTLLQIHQPKRILEIGTAIGYSALRMAQALPNTEITTIERDRDMLDIARRNVQNTNQTSHINIIHGDALDVMKTLQVDGEKFNFIFVDAAKGQYEHFFNLAHELLGDKGMIICDNILFRGYVAESEIPEQKRLQKITEKLQVFNDKLVHLQQYKTSIVPIGDGLAISVKV